MNRRRGCLAASLLAMVAFGSACGPREDAGNPLERAERLRAAGELSEARVELRSALRREPDSDEINFQIARVLQQQGRIVECLFYYEEALRLNPTRADAPLALAKLMLFEDADRSAELIEAVLERDPENSLAHVRHSELELVVGHLGRALSAAERAVELEPTDATTLRQLGVVRQAQIRDRQLRHLEPDPKLFRAALAAYQAVVQLREGEPVWRARMLRGRIFASWPGHSEDAAREYRAAIEEAATTGEPRALISLLRVTSEFARAARDSALERESLERWIEADPEAIHSWQRLAQLAEASDGTGLRVLDRLIEARPRDIEAHLLWARFRSEQGEVEAALEHLWGVASTGADPARTLGALTGLALQLGHPRQADRALERLKRTHPDHPQTLLASAQRALFDERFESAAETLRQLETRSSGEKAARLLAYAELRLGNLTAAASAVERAIERSRGAPFPAERLRARILEASGDCFGAQRMLGSLERRRQRLGPAELLIRARCLYELEQPRKGRAVLDRLLSATEPTVEAIALFARLEGHADPLRAQRLVDAALVRSPHDAKLLELGTRIDLATGRWTQALARLDAALPQAGRSAARIQLLRGRALAAAGDLSAAEQAVRAALHGDPEAPGAVPALAEIFRRQGNLSQVLAPLEQRRSDGQLRAVDLALLGRLHAEDGNESAARAALEDALAMGDAPPEAGNDLAYLLAKQGSELDRARELAVKARRDLGDDPSAADTLGFVHLESGLAASALAQFREALRLAQSLGVQRAVYHYHLGLALQALDRPEEALESVQAALNLGGTFPDATDAREMLQRLQSELQTGPAQPL